MRQPSLATLVLALTACKEDSGIKVTRFSFVGVQGGHRGQLRSVLATSPSSKLPFGEKQYFSRDQFEADLKRIEAFYRDRGFPDAKVTSYDTQLNKDQSSVAITVTIAEGEPIRVERVALEGLEVLPPEHCQTLEANLALKAGQPFDRARAAIEPGGRARRAQGSRLSLRDRESRARRTARRIAQRVVDASMPSPAR